MPSAPAASPSSANAIISSSSAGRGARSSSPITISRKVLWPTSMPVLTATAGNVSRYSGNRISRNGSHGAPPLK
jgi:hypothetical protein